MRTTTPNTLREHLKETLVKNIGSSTDLAETIHAIRDDEILDTFNIDSENIETPPVQRRAFRQKSLRASPSGNSSPSPSTTTNTNQQENGRTHLGDANESEAGSDFSGRRRNNKFRSLNGEGRPLGDRELIIKRKKESNQDLSAEGGGGRRSATDLEDELGNGLFDRFSSARKTLSRGSMRGRKKEELDTSCTSIDLQHQDPEKKVKSTDNWRSKIANKFRKNSDSYDFVEAERGQELRDYLGQITPMTEPTRRKPLNIDGDEDDDVDDLDAQDQQHNAFTNSKSSRQMTSHRDGPRGRTKSSRTDEPSNSNGRKSSYIVPGDYDSTLVDGKYVTSVPIVNSDHIQNGSAAGGTASGSSGRGQTASSSVTLDRGNIRPGRSLKDLKKATTAAAGSNHLHNQDPSSSRSSMIDRLSRSTTTSHRDKSSAAGQQQQRSTVATAASSPTSSTNSSVFDRLAGQAAAVGTTAAGKSASRTNLSSHHRTGSEARTSSHGLSATSSRSSMGGGGSYPRALSAPPDKPRGTFGRIRDISKDIKKNLRKGGRDGRDEPAAGGGGSLYSSLGSVRGPRNSASQSSILSAGSSTTTTGTLSARRPMSNVNGGSHPSIASSTRSLAKLNSNGGGRDSPRATSRITTDSNRLTPRMNSTRSHNGSISSMKQQMTQPSSSTLQHSKQNGKSTSTNTSVITNNGGARTTTSSKENLSRSSSSASRSSVTNSNGMSRNGSLRTTTTAAAAGGGTSSVGVSMKSMGSSVTSSRNNHLPNKGLASTLPKTRRPAKNGGMSFMKPTAASAKKVLGPSASGGGSTGVPPSTAVDTSPRKNSKGAVTASTSNSGGGGTTSSRVAPVSVKPSRR